MAVNCQAAVEAGGSPALERNQSSLVEDSAAMTIEFLRARLLSERAASRTARQEAQQIAKKVSELQSRLDLEIELRKKAEAAAQNVFTVLKTKGLSTEYFAIDECKPLQIDQNGSEEGFLSPDDSKEINSQHQLCDEICCCIDEKGAAGLELKRLAGRPQIGNESVLQSQIDVENVDAQCTTEEEKVYIAKEIVNFIVNGEDKECEVQDSLSKAIGIKEQESATEHCKMMKGTADESAGERQVAAQKLTGVPQKIEGQPQKLEGKEPTLNVELEEANSLKLPSHSDASLRMHQRPEHKKATSNDVHNQTDLNTTVSELDSFKHADGLLRLAGKVNSELNELVRKKADGRLTSSPAMRGDYVNSSEISMRSFDWQSASMDKSQIPIFSEAEQYNSWRSSSAHYPFLGVSQIALAGHDYTVAQRTFPTEVRSARDVGDSFKSDFDKKSSVYGHGYLPQSKGPVSETPSDSHVSISDVYPHVTVMDDLVCSTAANTSVSVYGNQETHSAGITFNGRINREFERGHPYHADTATTYCQGRALPGFSRTPEGFGLNLPVQNHMAHAPVDDKNGSIGDILTALHLAKLHVKGDEQLPFHPEDRLGPSTPTAARGKPYLRQLADDWRQLPYDDHPSWSEFRQAPIVQFPSSPSPDRGFSALDQHDELIRSNSGSPVPAFEADIQPSGKVLLGNGITLYTD